MSSEAKYQVMCELLDIHPAAWEKAEEQASRIIEMVRSGCSCSTSLPCGEATLSELDKLLTPVSVNVLPVEFTAEDFAYLHDHGHTWAEIAAEACITPEAARKRVSKWRAKQKEFHVTPKDETKNDIEPISPDGRFPEKDIMELIEAGAEEARQEAVLAEANRKPRLVTLDVDDQINQLIRSYAKEAFDIEILQAVRRQFPGITLSVKDIAARRRKA